MAKQHEPVPTGALEGLESEWENWVGHNVQDRKQKGDVKHKDWVLGVQNMGGGMNVVQYTDGRRTLRALGMAKIKLALKNMWDMDADMLAMTHTGIHVEQHKEVEREIARLVEEAGQEKAKKGVRIIFDPEPMEEAGGRDSRGVAVLMSDRLYRKLGPKSPAVIGWAGGRGLELKFADGKHGEARVIVAYWPTGDGAQTTDRMTREAEKSLLKGKLVAAIADARNAAVTGLPLLVMGDFNSVTAPIDRISVRNRKGKDAPQQGKFGLGQQDGLDGDGAAACESEHMTDLWRSEHPGVVGLTWRPSGVEGGNGGARLDAMYGTGAWAKAVKWVGLAPLQKPDRQARQDHRGVWARIGGEKMLTGRKTATRSTKLQEPRGINTHGLSAENWGRYQQEMAGPGLSSDLVKATKR